MNLRLAIGPATLFCGLLASCYPYETQTRRTQPKKTPQTKVEQSTKPHQEAVTTRDEKAGPETSGSTAPTLTTPTLPNNKPATPKPATATTKPEYPYAAKVPGKDGFVFSPYNNKVIDVRDIPSGTLVQDPTFPAADKKYFRVP